MCSLYCVGGWSGIMRSWSATSSMLFCFVFAFFLNEPTNLYLTFLLSVYVHW